jgi:ribosome maturation factor RimP
MELEEKIESIVQSLGVILYDISTLKEHDEMIYRVYVHSKEGISLDKCAEISHMLSPILDSDAPFNGEYRLEVSSPGIERKLKKLQHFEHSVGENVSITTFDKEKIKGKLIGIEGNLLHVKSKDGVQQIDYDTVSKAKTYFEW